MLNTAGQKPPGCWTVSRRWYRGELLMWVFASKITVKYPQTHNYCTWFYLTKLLTFRPLAFPAVLLLAGTLFCLSCRAAGRKQMLSFKQTKFPSTDSVESTSRHLKQMLGSDSGAVFHPKVLFFSEIKGENEKKKKVFLMHRSAAVAGRLVKGRQTLPNRDFPIRQELAQILGAILRLGRCLQRSGQLCPDFHIVRTF